MNMPKLLLYILPLLLLSGCATVDVTTTTVFAPDYRSTGTIAVIASVASVNGSKEFAQYKSRIESRLAANGYTVVGNPSDAAYVALVAYGMDLGLTGVVSTPVFGQAGEVSTTFASYGGSDYTMPSYGTVGSSSPSVTSYQRAIALDIVDTASIKEGKPKKVFELRSRSVGSSPSIACIFNELLEAMFMDFPGTSGKAKSITVPYSGDC